MQSTMGRKRATQKPIKPKTLKQAFSARLRELAKDTPASDIAEHVGATPDAVLKWLRGDSFPDIDRWPTIALYFGFADYREMLPKSPK